MFLFYLTWQTQVSFFTLWGHFFIFFKNCLVNWVSMLCKLGHISMLFSVMITEVHIRSLHLGISDSLMSSSQV